MHQLKCGSDLITYDLVRSRRKTLSICVHPEGTVTVRTPLGMPEEQIQKFIAEKAGWIIRKREEMCAKEKARPKRSYEDGETFRCQGQDCILKLKEAPDSKWLKVYQEEERIILEGPLQERGQRRELLRQWCIRQAGNQLRQRTAYFAGLVGEVPGQIHIREQKTRWGSASSQRNLNFNWKLILAPPEVLDYVVVHELCHLKHMNHAKEFWNLVEQIMPDYRKWREWLKEHGSELEV